MESTNTQPEVYAMIRADGSGEVIFQGEVHYLRSFSLEQLRSDAIGQVGRIAQSLGRPVRVNIDDPDGPFLLEVSPDGRVEETATSGAPAPRPAVPGDEGDEGVRGEQGLPGLEGSRGGPEVRTQRVPADDVPVDQTIRRDALSPADVAPLDTGPIQLRPPASQWAPPPAAPQVAGVTEPSTAAGWTPAPVASPVPPVPSAPEPPTPGPEISAAPAPVAPTPPAWTPPPVAAPSAVPGGQQAGQGDQPVPSAQPVLPAQPVQPAQPSQPSPPSPSSQPWPPQQAAPSWQQQPPAPSQPAQQVQLPGQQAQAAQPEPAAPPQTRRELRQSFMTVEQHEAPATQGVRGLLGRVGIRTQPSATERALREDERLVSQHWPGVRTIAVVNGKGGASKTPTTALLAAVFARYSGAATLAWDNNETRGTLGWRTEQGPHESTILQLLPELDHLLSPSARAGDISRFVHHQAGDKYDVLRSNPNLLAADQRITADDVDSVHDTLSKFYKLMFIDSGNDESAGHWLRMVSRADQLVVPTIARPEHAEAGALLLEALSSRGGRFAELASTAVVVVSQAREKDSSPSAAEIAKGFEGWVADAVTIPYDRAMVENVLRYDALSPTTQRAWLRAAAAVARSL